MISRVVASIAITNNGRILLGKKPKGRGPYPDTWHLPGGGIELEKESIQDAARREAKEETNLELNELKEIGYSEDYALNKENQLTHFLFLLFQAESRSDNFTPGDDIEELKWFTKDEIDDIEIAKPSKENLKKIIF